jgi:hypothetical protein
MKYKMVAMTEWNKIEFNLLEWCSYVHIVRLLEKQQTEHVKERLIIYEVN